MTLKEIYIRLLNLAEKNYIEKPMLVGGVPRDIFLGRGLSKDVDLTTNDADCPRLGLALASDLSYGFKMFEDGHVSIYTTDYTIDFSSNFVSQKAIEYAKDEHRSADPFLYEVYSRDFTINTLHKELLQDQLIDPTNLAIKDLEKRIIRPVTSSDICFGDDPRRIFRAISFATRLGFDIDGEVVDYARDHFNFISNELGKSLRDAFLTSIISESISNDSDKALGYLVDMGLLSLIPLTGSFKDELIRRRMVTMYLDDADKRSPGLV